MGKLRAILGCMALCCSATTGTAFGQSTQLGLYDAAGYPYYPIDVQIYGATRAQTRVISAGIVSRESTQAAPIAHVAKARRPQVRLGYSPDRQNTAQVSRQRASLRPMPVSGANIMDPWAVGVFR